MNTVAIDSVTAEKLRTLYGIACDAGDAATMDACMQALRGDLRELLDLADALSALD